MNPTLALLLACTARGPVAGTDSGDTGTAGSQLFGDPQAAVHEVQGAFLRVSWQQLRAGRSWVEYREQGAADWRSSPVQDLDAGPAEQLVVGLPYDTDAEWRLWTDLGEGPQASETGSLRTDPPPEGLPLTQLLLSQPDALSPEGAFWLVSMNGPEVGMGDAWTMVVDRQGRPIWARSTPHGWITLHPRVAMDGHSLLIDESTFWTQYDGGAGSRVFHEYLDGTVIEQLDTPGLHHPFTDLPDGSLVYPSVLAFAEDHLVRRAPDGSLETFFSCQQWRQDNGLDATCGSNTIWWNPDDGHFFYSLYTHNTVIEVDPDTGSATRWFGQAAGSWAFDDPETGFWWQHGAQLTADGTLLLSARVAESEPETVWREYALDEEQQTLVQVASFGEGEGLYGDVMGEAWRMDNGDTVHNTGSLPRLREVTPAGEVVWDLSWDAQFIGRSTPIADLYDLLP